MERGLRQLAHLPESAGMLYFHPWEFDPEQPRLPLGRMARFRTYVGVSQTRSRLESLLKRRSYVRAIDIVEKLEAKTIDLPRFQFGRATMRAAA
jgi:hypothetical protein